MYSTLGTIDDHVNYPPSSCEKRNTRVWSRWRPGGVGLRRAQRS
jgi:hypothetical protein